MPNTPAYYPFFKALERNPSGRRHKVEHLTADKSLSCSDSGGVFTNLGATGAVTVTLPQDAKGEAGIVFDFHVMAAQQLRVDAGAAGALYIGGVKQADDAYAWADDEGEWLRVVSDGNGDWMTAVVGTWTVV